jgi:hypothetical protein
MHLKSYIDYHLSCWYLNYVQWHDDYKMHFKWEQILILYFKLYVK